jgi:pyridoxal phosphate enzyme (YggS family)
MIEEGMHTTAERARVLLAEISHLERVYGRAPGSVALIGISKKHPARSIREAWTSGVRQFGESYLQEALPKIAELDDLAIVWHFVGRIQANKTAAVAASFAWVHGLDRLRIAQRLNDQRPPDLPPLNCCLEVNLGNEGSKGGVSEQHLAELAAAVARMPRLSLRGLMTLPVPDSDLARQREPFARLAQLLAQLRMTIPQMDTLSMGMSADIEAAIAEGATMVRIGTALFGPREQAGGQHDLPHHELVHRGRAEGEPREE